jgi:hypothetical protein
MIIARSRLLHAQRLALGHYSSRAFRIIHLRLSCLSYSCHALLPLSPCWHSPRRAPTRSTVPAHRILPVRCPGRQWIPESTRCPPWSRGAFTVVSRCPPRLFLAFDTMIASGNDPHRRLLCVAPSRHELFSPLQCSCSWVRAMTHSPRRRMSPMSVVASSRHRSQSPRSGRASFRKERASKGWPRRPGPPPGQPHERRAGLPKH